MIAAITTGVAGLAGTSIALGAAGQFLAATTVSTGGVTPRAIERANLNGDGRPDLAVANFASGDVSILFGTAGGGFIDQGIYTTGAGSHDVATGDFDNDADIDLAIANANDSSVSIRLNNGNGTFGNGASITGLFVPYTVEAANLNGDSNIDLVTRGHDTARVLFGNGNGTFNAPVDYSVGSDVRLVEIADLDNQNGPDIVTANWVSNSVSVLLNNGAGAFAPAVDYTVGTNPGFVEAADLNGDGFRDLTTANFGSANVSILLNDQDGTFTAGPAQTVGNEPEEVRVDDLDGDGDRDLVVGNRADDDISVLLNAGPGVVYDRTDYSATNPRGLSLGDTNADGFSDIVATNGSGNSLSVLLNNPAPPLAQASINDISVEEGDAGTTAATLTVSLDRTSTGPVSIGYATVNRSAAAPGDFSEKQGSLAFAPGETSRQVSIDIVGDTVEESEEVFEVHLINPSNATIAKAIGRVTIVDNDSGQSVDPPAEEKTTRGTPVVPYTVRNFRIPRLIATCGNATPKGNEPCRKGPFEFRTASAANVLLRKLAAKGIPTRLKDTSRVSSKSAKSPEQQKALRESGVGGEITFAEIELENADGSSLTLDQGGRYDISTDQTATLRYSYFDLAKDKGAIAEEKKELQKEAERLAQTRNSPPKSKCLPIAAGESNKQILDRFPPDAAGYRNYLDMFDGLAKLGCGVEISKYVRGKPSAPRSYVADVSGRDAKRDIITVVLAQPGSHDFIFAIREQSSQWLANQNKNSIPLGTDGKLTTSDTQVNRFTVQVIERASGRLVPGIQVTFGGKIQTTDSNGETTFATLISSEGAYRLSAEYKDMEGWRTIRATDRGSRSFTSLAGRNIKASQGRYVGNSQEQLQFAAALPVLPANLGSGNVGEVVSIPQVRQATVTTFDAAGNTITGQHNVVDVPSNSNVLVGAGSGLLALGGGTSAQVAARPTVARAGVPNPLEFLAGIVGGVRSAIDAGTANVRAALGAANQAAIAAIAQALNASRSNLISDKGLGVISVGGGNVIGTGGLNLISDKGLGVISVGGGNLIGQAGGNLIGDNGAAVISTGGGNLIPVFGGKIISRDGAG